MAQTEVPSSRLGLGLLLLLSGLRCAAPAGELANATGLGRARTDALSLCYKFIVTPKFGNPWCHIQGELNGDKFLHYDCGNKTLNPFGSLGMKLRAMEGWDTQKEILNDLMEEVKKSLLVLKTDTSPHRGHVSLQGMFTCHSAAYGSSSSTWEFSFNGQIILCFDPEKRTWLVVRPEGQQLKEILDEDRDILETFVKISNGECKRWLESIAESWGQMPETTAPPATAPPTMTSGTAQSTVTAITPIITILTLAFSGIIGIQR
ncbi:UL16-binding protein 6-like isoform X2 [Manis pentadactyla]|nr:UL16-binding protein 6-like isoform X2 [Manis pentadactyla]KAI5193722.1 Ul16-Binding Protein 6 [Manis pentadactyla]